MARAIDKDYLLKHKRKVRFFGIGPDDESWGYAVPAEIIENVPTITPPNEWVSVEERLPENSERWETYIVAVNRSHWPTSSYDPCDAPYDEELVVSAQYDSKQKIWHLPWDEQLNALIQADDAPINGDFVTHWMPLPAPPAKGGDR